MIIPQVPNTDPCNYSNILVKYKCIYIYVDVFEIDYLKKIDVKRSHVILVKVLSKSLSHF